MEKAEAVAPETPLKGNSLSMIEVLTQSVANMAPTAAMALLPALVFANAGNGTLISFIIAIVITLLVGYSVSIFATRLAAAGSFYVYINRALGSLAAFSSGWGLILGYIFTGCATVVATGIFVGQFLEEIGIHTSGAEARVLQVVLMVIGLLIPVVFAYRDITLSARTSLVLEAVSVSAILIIDVIVFVKKGFPSQLLTFSGLNLKGVILGVVLAVFAFVGFESAASLGREARNPFHSVPRAVLWSCFLVGVFYLFTSAAQVTGFEGATKPDGKPFPLSDSQAPLTDIADFLNLHWLGLLILLGITASLVSCTLACINAGSRIIYQLGRDGLFGPSAGRVHEVNKTPHIAIFWTAPWMFLVPAVLVLFGQDPVTVNGWVGTIATFGFFLAYVLVAIAAPLFLVRHRESPVLAWIAGIIAALAILIVFIFNTPLIGMVDSALAPPWPLSLFPLLFIGYVVAGGLWYLWVRARTPHVMAQIGQESHEVAAQG